MLLACIVSNDALHTHTTLSISSGDYVLLMINIMCLCNKNGVSFQFAQFIRLMDRFIDTPYSSTEAQFIDSYRMKLVNESTMEENLPVC